MMQTTKFMALRWRRTAFTLVEAMIVSGLMALLGVLISGVWSGLGRPLGDSIARCRVAQEANLAVAYLTRDLGGSLADTTGTIESGRVVGRLLVGSSQLWLCFDGGSPNGVADWGSPDTVILYYLQSGTLVREDQTGPLTTVITVARHVDSMTLTEQGDGVKIDLTFSYRDITQTYTLNTKDP